MLRTSKSILNSTSNVQSLCLIFIKRHASKSDRIKKWVQDKLVYGTLIETKVQKQKRLKLEKKGKIPQQNPNTKDTELLWVMNNSGNKLKKIMLSTKMQNKQLNLDENQDRFLKKSNKVRDKSPVDQNTKGILNSGSNQVQKIELEITNSSSVAIKNINNIYNKTNSATKTEHLDEDISIQDSNIHNNTLLSNSDLSNVESAITKYDVSSTLERIPDIIIKNLPSFPIMGNKKVSSVQSTEVLSISRTDPETINFPSVTRILMQTMPLESKLALEAWKERMIKKLGQEGFKMHQKALLEDGASLHSCIAQNLLGKEYEIPLRIEPVFKSVQSVLGDVHHVRAIETHVAHTKLCYKGVVDCIASYRGENYVIDWKKSDRKKSELKQTYDAPVQIAAYIGAINASNIYPFVIKRGLLVIAYTCGTPATVYEVCDNTLQQYWTAWLRRLQKYYVETRNDDNKSIRQ